jgi:5-methylthioribose kinase
MTTSASESTGNAIENASVRESSYELLTPETIAAFLDSRPTLTGMLDTSTPLEAHEIGDGNLNLIFVVHDRTGSSLVLKQALPYVRMAGPSWPLTPERNTSEARALRVHGVLAPEYVPAFYDFDHDRHVITMEDLSAFEVWRGALNRAERHDGAANDMGIYIARVAFGTSAFGVEAKELKSRVAEAVNPWLCEITEDLVFSEPYIEAERDWYQGEVRDEVETLRSDRRFVAAIGEMKFAFMTRAEALIHGDLHTGSVMVHNGTTARAFDSEFAYYGPVGFDLSCLFGNYLFAYLRAVVLEQDEQAEWIRTLPSQTWEGFVAEVRRLWPDRIDPAVFNDEYLCAWLDSVHSDAIGMTAAELCRRTIGYAHVSDIETLEPLERAKAVRVTLRTARRIALEHGGHRDPELLMSVAEEELAKILKGTVRYGLGTR